MTLRAALLLLGVGLGVAQAAPADPQSARFDAAIALESQGRIEDAATALEAFARERPDDPLAPDALAEAAALCETRLHDPARALTAWRTLAERYPQSRAAGRAAQRRDALARLLAGGDAAEVGALQRLLDEAGSPPRTEARAAVQDFLVAHPTSPLTGEARLWLAQTATDDREAARQYELAIHAGGATAARAIRAQAELLLRLQRLAEAERAFESLTTFDDAAAREARERGLAAVQVARARARWALAALVALGLLFLAGIAIARAVLWPIPLEVRFFAPVAALFAICARTQPGAIARAVALIAIGATTTLWIVGALRPRATGIVVPIALIAGAGGAIAAITYLAIYHGALVELVVETWRNGPER